MPGGPRRALVTGGARGLGRAIVTTLAQRGYEVWAADILPIGPGQTDAQHAVQMDVTDEASVMAAFEPIDALGGLDVLVNNAGIFPQMHWDDPDMTEWHRTLGVNLTGSFICARAAGRSMRAHGRGGSIVNISSLTFWKGRGTGPNYTASKGGVVGLTRSLARALGPYSIRVNSVAPGLVDTEGVLEKVERGHFPRGRLENRSDARQLPGVTEAAGVAATVAFLASDDAREVTGQTIAADGGTIFL